MRRRLPSAACSALTVAAVLVSGCAARTTGPGLASRLVRGADGPGGVAWPAAPAETTAATPPAAAGDVPVESSGAEAAIRPRHELREAAALESVDARLEAALKVLETRPTVEGRLAAAGEYRRLGVFDRAHRLLTDALAESPRDARIFDALARLWRDWGVPGQGLGDAYRAAAAAPESPGVQNTLATVLFALGRVEAAEARWEEAGRLDAGAAWVRSNRCYAALARGDEARALDECRAALAIDPGFVAARNNLALVHAAAGRWTEAEREFLAAAGDEAVGRFNLGMALLASRDPARAAEAFERAAALRPDLELAHTRARQARRLAEADGPTEGGK